LGAIGTFRWACLCSPLFSRALLSIIFLLVRARRPTRTPSPPWHPLDCTASSSEHYVVAPDSLVLDMTCSVIEEHDYLQSLTLPQPLQGSDTEALELAWASRYKPVLPPIEWQMAVAMSLHPRLGGDSHLNRLESLMVRFAGFCACLHAHACFSGVDHDVQEDEAGLVGSCLNPNFPSSSVAQIKDIVERTSSQFELRLTPDKLEVA
jgi:hypothetical protein